MNELYDQIQTAIIADQRPHGTRPVLLQILDLHGPTDKPNYYGHLQCETCASMCHSGSGLGCEPEGDVVYPCDTVRLIAQGYGIEVDG